MVDTFPYRGRRGKRRGGADPGDPDRAVQFEVRDGLPHRGEVVRLHGPGEDLQDLGGALAGSGLGTQTTGMPTAIVLLLSMS